MSDTKRSRAMSQTPSRRRFLTALGAAAFAQRLSLGKSWADSGEPQQPGGSATGAGVTGKPLRFVGVFAPHGCAYELWKPGPGFDLRYADCSLSPFDSPERFGRSFKDALLVIDGLDLAAGLEAGTVGHDASRVIYTGSAVTGKNPSIDQFLAVEQMLGADTPFTSVTLAVGNDKTELGANISYAAGGTPIPKWIDPVVVFDELFGAPLTEQGKQALRATRRRRESVLDFVRGDLARLQERVPTQERVKIEQHTTALREIEKRISPIQRDCRAKGRPDPARFPRLEAYGGGEPYFEVITELQVDLLAQALSCDMTRFSTLMLADLTRSGLYPELPEDIHQGVAHRYFAHTDMGPGKPETWKPLAIQNRHSYAHVARLLQRLDEGGVFEETIVVVQSDMGDTSRHSSRNVPTVVAGGCGGHFKMGRVIDKRTGKGDVYAPNNRLLVSICNAFGVPVERYGQSANSQTVTGALTELYG